MLSVDRVDYAVSLQRRQAVTKRFDGGMRRVGQHGQRDKWTQLCSGGHEQANTFVKTSRKNTVVLDIQDYESLDENTNNCTKSESSKVETYS